MSRKVCENNDALLTMYFAKIEAYMNAQRD